jgi:hypothetical protein
VRFGILRVHRILRKARVRVTTTDATGRLGPIRYSLRDTARTRSVLANPDPAFARTQRTSWGQFPPAAWVGFIAQATADESGSSIHCAFRDTGRYPPQSRSDSGGAHVGLIFLNSRSPGPDYRSSQCWPIGKHQERRGLSAHRPPDSEMPRCRER